MSNGLVLLAMILTYALATGFVLALAVGAIVLVVKSLHYGPETKITRTDAKGRSR